MHFRLLNVLSLLALVAATEAADAPNLADPKVHPYADPAKGREGHELAGETVNEARLYDFYARQADYYLKQDKVPDLLPAYPGIEAGLYGHWGKHSQNDVVDDAWSHMEGGSVLAAVVKHRGRTFTKAVNVQLGNDLNTLFDPGSLSYPLVWSGSFLNLPTKRFGIVGSPSIGGAPVFETDSRMDWQLGGKWEKGFKTGQARYHGYHRHGNEVIFAYSLGHVTFLDRPGSRKLTEGMAFVRDLEWTGDLEATSLKLFKASGMNEVSHHGRVLVSEQGGQATVIVLASRDENQQAKLGVGAGGSVVVELGRARREGGLRVSIWKGPKGGVQQAVDALLKAQPERLEQFTNGGPALWSERLTLQGQLADNEDGPYVLDTLPVPTTNPYKSPMFLGGLDFLSNGDAVVCTFFGDVWKVGGIDHDLKAVTWQRIATGLNQALGVAVVRDQIYVLGKDQITQLIDLNDDGEADFYRNFCNAFRTSPGGHDFNVGLQVSDLGYFYFSTGHEGIIEVSPDGAVARTVAYGIRNPDGIGVSPDGIVSSSPNEGQWTPCTMVVEAQEGEFYGFRRQRKGNEPIAPPLVYLPRGVDNSTGSQVWVTSDQWGPLKGQMLSTSFGAGTHYLVLRDTDGGRSQGAVVPLKGEFVSGSHRARFHPVDGQLYVAGMQGWGDYAVEDGCLQRVRYTGQRVRYPVGFKIHANGIRIDFDSLLSPETVKSTRNFMAQMWNYEYSDGYGSHEFSIRQPEKLGHDHLPVTSAHLVNEGRSLFLEIPALQTAMQMHLRLHLTFKDGVKFSTEMFPTVVRLGEAFTGFPNARPLVAGKADFITLRIFDPAPVKKKETPKNDKGREILIKGVTGLRYDTLKIKAKAGERLTITMKNTDPAMPHNWVLVKPAGYQKVGNASMQMLADPKAAQKHYVPDSPDVIVHTSVVNPGQSDSITFNAPTTPGEYPYMCTYPGHWALMKGLLVVY